jgi:hypothetical protein
MSVKKTTGPGPSTSAYTSPIGTRQPVDQVDYVHETSMVDRESDGTEEEKRKHNRAAVVQLSDDARKAMNDEVEPQTFEQEEAESSRDSMEDEEALWRKRAAELRRRSQRPLSLFNAHLEEATALETADRAQRMRAEAMESGVLTGQDLALASYAAQLEMDARSEWSLQDGEADDWSDEEPVRRRRRRRRN